MNKAAGVKEPCEGAVGEKEKEMQKRPSWEVHEMDVQKEAWNGVLTEVMSLKADSHIEAPIRNCKHGKETDVSKTWLKG